MSYSLKMNNFENVWNQICKEFDLSNCKYKNINCKEREITCISHFIFSEAKTAELFTKDTYIKYARILIGHRAFTLGARDIGSDLLMGVMETGELKIVEGIDLSPNDYEIIEEIK